MLQDSRCPGVLQCVAGWIRCGLSESSCRSVHALGGNDGIQLDAPPTVAANFAMVNGVPHSYLANFGGLGPGKVAVAAPVHSIHVKVPAAMGHSLFLSSFPRRNASRAHGEKRGDLIEFTLPPLERGAVVSVIGGK